MEKIMSRKINAAKERLPEQLVSSRYSQQVIQGADKENGQTTWQKEDTKMLKKRYELKQDIK